MFVYYLLNEGIYKLQPEMWQDFYDPTKNIYTYILVLIDLLTVKYESKDQVS